MYAELKRSPHLFRRTCDSAFTDRFCCQTRKAALNYENPERHLDSPVPEQTDCFGAEETPQLGKQTENHLMRTDHGYQTAADRN